jgi:hypothetical protein
LEIEMKEVTVSLVVLLSLACTSPAQLFRGGLDVDKLIERSDSIAIVKILKRGPGHPLRFQENCDVSIVRMLQGKGPKKQHVTISPAVPNNLL